jgi:hypothetical protein
VCHEGHARDSMVALSSSITSDGSALISEGPSTERFLGYAYQCKFVFVFGVFVICLPPLVSRCMPECLQLYCQCVYVMFFPESAKTTCISSYDIEVSTLFEYV